MRYVRKLGFMTLVTQKISDAEKCDKHATTRLLIKRILAGSLVILFIGVCSFAVLFTAMCLL